MTACLTPRNVQVLAAYARTGSVKVAADELHIGTSSVSKHLARCRAGVGVPTTVQAVYVLFGLGARAA